jgi:hypothetical protein
MTNLNESLAIFMGAEANPDGHWTEYWKFPCGTKMSKNYWNPCGDLNQASLVIKKLGEMGLEAEFVNALYAETTMRDLDSAAATVRTGLGYLSIFALLTTPPELICQAAYKVIKGGEAC